MKNILFVKKITVSLINLRIKIVQMLITCDLQPSLKAPFKKNVVLLMEKFHLKPPNFLAILQLDIQYCWYAKQNVKVVLCF